jgi:hypothetical protein
MPARRRETEAQKKARLIREIIDHPETLGYHPESKHTETHATSFDIYSIEELEEILENADKKLASAS